MTGRERSPQVAPPEPGHGEDSLMCNAHDAGLHRRQVSRTPLVLNQIHLLLE
jgi:hypothetical protein